MVELTETNLIDGVWITERDQSRCACEQLYAQMMGLV
jgi:hypothetical protein